MALAVIRLLARSLPAATACPDPGASMHWLHESTRYTRRDSHEMVSSISRDLAVRGSPTSRTAVLIRPGTIRPRRFRSSSTLILWCPATLFRMLEKVFALIDSGAQPLHGARADLRGDPHLGTAAPHGLVAQPVKRHQQRSPAHVTGQLHPARTSSRTKCTRISFGRCMPSPT